MRKTSTTRLAVGTALAVGLLVALLLVNPVAAFRDTRDWLLQTFGLGLAIMAALGGAGAVARWRKVHRKMPAALLVRRVAGIIASALFAWGLLGFNRADWSLWGTDFRAVTLGGETGAWLVGGFIGTLTWLALGLIAALLLQPRGTIAAGKGVGTGFIYALEHRWPQRAAGTTWRIAAGVFDRRPTEPRPEEDIVIGVGTPMEEPRQFEGRPALVTTADENDVAKTAEADGAEASEPDEPEEPTQLGLDLEQDSGNWHYPALDLLNTPLPSTQRKYDNQARAQLIVDTLASFGVDASVVEVNEGPTVTQFGV
ncbi:MAG: DNA translocase FtsK, partial [Dehalococcoidia bacterium]